jgi:hypothetical protein
VSSLGVWWRKSKEGNHFQYQGVDGRTDSIEIVLTVIEWERVLMRYNEDRGRWLAVLNTVLNIRVP